MRFDLEPLRSVGPISFGMARDDVRRVLAAPFESFMKTPQAVQTADDFAGLNIHVYYDSELRCNGVELWPGADFRVDGSEVLRRPWGEVKTWLPRLDPRFKIQNSCVSAFQIGLSLYVPDVDDEADALIESAYVFQVNSA